MNKIVTQVLDACKQYQNGRVTVEVTPVTFDFTDLAVGGALPKLAGETAPVRGMVWGGRLISARVPFGAGPIYEERGVEIRSGGGAICSHYYRV